MAIHTGKRIIVPGDNTRDFSPLTRANRGMFLGTVDALAASKDYSNEYKRLFFLGLELIKSSATTDRFKIMLEAITALINKFTNPQAQSSSPFTIISNGTDYTKDSKLQNLIKNIKPQIEALKNVIGINPKARKALEESKNNFSQTIIVDSSPVDITFNRSSNQISEDMLINGLAEINRKLDKIQDLGAKGDIEDPGVGLVIKQDLLLYQLLNRILQPFNQSIILFDLTHMEEKPLLAMLGLITNLARWRQYRLGQLIPPDQTSQALDNVLSIGSLATRKSDTDSDLVRDSIRKLSDTLGSKVGIDSGPDNCAICQPGIGKRF
jgi:hypothetical protein